MKVLGFYIFTFNIFYYFQLACKLLEEAKRKQRWKVAQDIIRYFITVY